MTLRIKIAKWLAPEVFRARDEWEYYAIICQETGMEWSTKAMSRGFTLRKIASQRTPKANATVNRMADMAEAALKGEG